MIRRRVQLSGRVQGVYFRESCRRMAVESGVNGWIRNLPDGRVEAVFEGRAQDVQRLVDWASRGPGMAVVHGVEVHQEAPEGLSAFSVR